MKKLIILAIVCLLPVAVFYHAGLLELRLEEPRRALVALEMIFRKSFIVPEINGEVYYTKPPLFNWLIALSFWISGNYGEWAARMPGLLSYFATGLVLYWFAKKFFSKEKALLATLFFYTASDLLLFGTIISAEIDLFFTMMITLQQVMLYYFFSRKQWLAMFALSYAFTALGVLAKGVPAILFQGVSLVVLVCYCKRFKLLFSWQHLIGLLCFALIAGSYFLAYYHQTGELYPYIAKLFYDAAEKSVLENSFLKSLLNFLQSPLHLLRFFAPWFLFVIFLFKRNHTYWSNKTIGYFTWAVAINLVPMLFTAETKANYIYPIFPLIGLLLANIYVEYRPLNLKKEKVIYGIAIACIGLVFIAILGAPFISEVRISVGGLWYKTIIAAALVGAIGWGMWHLQAERIYLLILFMVVARLLSGIYYLPLYKQYSNQQKAKSFINSITQRAGDQPIYLAGPPQVQQAYVAMGPLAFDTVQITMPPFLLYQVPFYYSVKKQAPMLYDSVMKPGRYYVLYTDYAPDSLQLQIWNDYKPSKSGKEHFYFVSPRNVSSILPD